MKETMLAAIFVIHAVAFAYFYLRRERRAFYLLFCGGFVLLAGYYAYNSRQFFAGVESGPAWLLYFRWAGLILCALATPFFLTHMFRKRRGAGGTPLGK
ncbi:MAG: hypothetical protein HWN68_03900 [Desulfobacterales bacterium]|nr:hypothetical protein [Desulfobacterales bacterium]